MEKTVVGLMDSFDEARGLIEDLLDNGFSDQAIGLIAREPEGGAQAAAREKRSDEQIAGVKVGFEAGAAVGGVAGLVIGIAAFTVPGVGAVLAAGPLAAALAGVGLGAMTGGVYGAIRNLGVPEDEVEYYAQGIERGGILVTVATDEAGAEDAAEIMSRHGAMDIKRRAEGWRSAPQGSAEQLSPRDRPDH
jgi:hypothetical protein